MRYASPNDLPPRYRQQVHEKSQQLRNTQMSRLLASASKRQPHKSEHEEQVEFFEEIAKLAAADPRYAIAVRRTFAIPNGGFRDPATAGKLKAEGVKPGVSDVMCALPCKQWHGLFVEFKSMTGGASPEQRDFLIESFDLCYLAVCCRGCEHALIVWKRYVEGTFE